MATLDEVIIADKGSAFDSGIALLLQQECPVNEVVSIAPSWEAEVRSGSAYVVARTKGVGGNTQASREDQQASETFNYAYEAAQRGLDFLSVAGKADLSIRDAHSSAGFAARGNMYPPGSWLRLGGYPREAASSWPDCGDLAEG